MLLLLLLSSSFDELLELSQRGDNRAIDMLVGDIYGGMDYSKVIYVFVCQKSRLESNLPVWYVPWDFRMTVV